METKKTRRYAFTFVNNFLWILFCLSTVGRKQRHLSTMKETHIIFVFAITWLINSRQSCGISCKKEKKIKPGFYEDDCILIMLIFNFGHACIWVRLFHCHFSSVAHNGALKWKFVKRLNSIYNKWLKCLSPYLHWTTTLNRIYRNWWTWMRAVTMMDVHNGRHF